MTSFMTWVLTFVPGFIGTGIDTGPATTPHEGDPFVVISLGVLSFITIVYFIVSMFKDNS
ncbi:hypothetical protein HNR44_001029 [Geomicrobium halophilum]|uniref:Uncharacterized protein n=1 Tax=Geomicrobium halophilum TaxID=549000 RepID=A0A841PJX1_9BACL|nr:hypothetical protein [Geomicrobium halophilum]MBB6449080.1 hypothetical protein [Geomicrobium halophilum]